MPSRESMNVSLTPELAAFVDAQVASGRYRSASEVVRAALRELHDHEAWKAEVREKIEEGLKSLAEGKGVDGPAFMEQLEQKLQARLDAERRRSA
ncbi:MAG: type II toxin-antitoxin system ParD family antitoxin [Phycisphaerales bacterium JB039]